MRSRAFDHTHRRGTRTHHRPPPSGVKGSRRFRLVAALHGSPMFPPVVGCAWRVALSLTGPKCRQPRNTIAADTVVTNRWAMAYASYGLVAMI